MEKKAFSILLIIVSVTLIIGLMPVHGEEKIYGSVVRFHVLANSDSEEDQANKLKVRDAVVALTGELLSGAVTRDDAVAVLEKNKELICDTARMALAEVGSHDDVTIKIGEEYYPTRDYEDVAFPAGNYLSVRLCIGKAEGKNWWCVLFPPICLSAATADTAVSKSNRLEEAFIAAGLTPDEYRIITESKKCDSRYRVRFKILEIIGEAVKKVQSGKAKK